MNSVILQIATKYIRSLLLLFAILALLRGHNHPGGGFIGGLLAGLSVVYASLAYSAKDVQQKLKIQPYYYIGLGLFLALISALPGLWTNSTLLQGVWTTIPLPFGSAYKIGTPLLFDIGVFFTVIGVTLQFFFTLSNKD